MVAKYAKAFYGAAVASLSAIAAVLVDNASISDLTDGQWVTVVLAGLIAFGGIAGIKNAE